MQIINIKDVPHRFNVAIIISRCYQDITQKLLKGAITRLQDLGFNSDQITSIWVPSIVEIPLTAQRLAKTEEFAVIIGLGVVIFEEMKYVDHLTHQVNQGCQRVALTNDIPIIPGILMTDTLAEAQDRAKESIGNTGYVAAENAFELISVLQQI